MSISSVTVDASQFCRVDPRECDLVVLPGAVGLPPGCRVQVHRGAELLVTSLADEAGTVRVPLAQVVPLRGASITLQVPVGRRRTTWQDWNAPAPLHVLGDVALWQVDPQQWGMGPGCRMLVHDDRTGELMVDRTLSDGSTVPCVYRPGVPGNRYRLSFRDGRGRRTPLARLVEHQFRAARPATEQHGALELTRRRDVVLAPLVLVRGPRSGIDTWGYLGAWSEGHPVPEAMEFALRRQRYLFQPVPPTTERHFDRLIYLGSPHGQFGHFLTQGLSRAWYALEHPDVPVVWDASRLLPFQHDVLDAIGLRNECVFLDAPLHADEVVFPFPGIGLGDYVQPEFAQVLGLIEPSRVIEGKKLFLSRAGMDRASGDRLDDLVVRHGFTLYRPEEHPVLDQLAELSSAQVVLGVEGSALHSLLLLRDPVGTSFWSLARHRGGGGVYGHIKAAKSLRYETLDFRSAPCRSAREELHLDLDALDEALAATHGFTTNLEVLADRTMDVRDPPTPFATHLDNCQTRIGERETELLAQFVGRRSEEAGAVLQWLSRWA